MIPNSLLPRFCRASARNPAQSGVARLVPVHPYQPAAPVDVPQAFGFVLVAVETVE
jgi:hypothetical protein